MKYVSTRGASPALSFAEATMAGLAPDGGLYLPQEWPQLAPEDIAGFAGQRYEDVAFAVMQPFIGDDVPASDLKALIDAAYSRFNHTAMAPLKQLSQKRWLLELFHGPTLAFKDFALQFLGHVFEYLLDRSGTHLTIIGATSGDTGSAAIDALAGRDHIDIFMLHPHERVSPVQRRQMTTVQAPNVFNLAIDGTFDDAQALVKRGFGDDQMREKLNLSAVNSINWTRVMAQIVYYFYAAAQLGAPGRAVSFSVPTGNFGDIFAGYCAHKMGLPIDRLIVATNRNDILHRAIQAGDYSANGVTPTISPSMDIQVASNFERLLYDCAGQDGRAVAQMMAQFNDTKSLSIPADVLSQITPLFTSARADEDATAEKIRATLEQTGELVDPHTAVGLVAADQMEATCDGPMVVLATAHPGKFRSAVERACGTRPSLPSHLAGLFDREERFEELPNDFDALRAYVFEKRGV
ncbi:MAG: threonine synthase [Pseudomonadota bacterium]